MNEDHQTYFEVLAPTWDAPLTVYAAANRLASH